MIFNRIPPAAHSGAPAACGGAPCGGLACFWLLLLGAGCAAAAPAPPAPESPGTPKRRRSSLWFRAPVWGRARRAGGTSVGGWLRSRGAACGRNSRGGAGAAVCFLQAGHDPRSKNRAPQPGWVQMFPQAGRQTYRYQIHRAGAAAAQPAPRRSSYWFRAPVKGRRRSRGVTSIGWRVGLDHKSNHQDLKPGQGTATRRV